nr:lysophospholipid acyltransferase family protein [Kocuria sp. 36]
MAKYHSRALASLRFVLQRVLFRGLVLTAIRPSVKLDPGVRQLEGGFLVVANHASHVDAPIIAQSLPRQQAKFLAAGVAFDYFFQSWPKRWFVRLLFNAFPIYRGGSHSNSAIPRALLRTGLPVLLFPEGGRQRTGAIADFKVGSLKLAIDTGVPIVPTAVVGGYDAMPKGRSWPLPGRPPVRVVFGAPFTPAPGESPAACTTRVQALIEDLYDAGSDEIGVARLTRRNRSADQAGNREQAGRERGENDLREDLTDSAERGDVTDEGMKN